MSWQEDLRQLDADLAAGRIEPAAHRKERDELLAQASGVTVPSPVPSPLRRPSRSWQTANPATHRTVPPERVETPQPRPPQPPPWARPTPAKPAAPLERPGSPGFPDHLTTAPSPADIVPTRYLRVEGRVPGPQVSRFPEVRTAEEPHDPPQPPEFPEPAGRHRDAGSRGRHTWLFLSAGVLVVLALIVGGTMWLGSTTDPAPSPGLPPVPAGVQAAPLEDRLPPLPGVPNPNNSTMSVAKGRDLGLYLPATADLLARNGAKQVIFRGSGDGDVSYLVVVAPTDSPASAQSVIETLYQQALEAGFKPVQSDVRTVSGNDGTKFLNTTWYGSGGNVVIVGTAQPYHRQAGMSGELDRAVKAFEDVLPAG